MENTATRIIRRQITFGGSLGTREVRYALAGTLSALQGEVEIKSNLGPRTETQWLEVERLYDKQGQLLLKGNELITRIRISFERETFS
ncbi:MAG: molybdopterin dehydrogenase, partial [Spirochaetales bacterium]|nr:molybdopterin dehydrogenase [Spirochaetales bacterium]